MQTVLLAPWAVPVVVIPFLFRYMFEQQGGIVNAALLATGAIAAAVPRLSNLYPLAGHMLAPGDAAFGTWSGVAVNDTGQVVAASSAYSLAVRVVATVVQLVRDAFMAPLIVLIAWWWQRHADVTVATVRRGVVHAVPFFVVGFVALAGVGLNTRIRQMRAIGRAPFYVGLGTAGVLAALSLGAVVAFVHPP